MLPYLSIHTTPCAALRVPPDNQSLTQPDGEICTMTPHQPRRKHLCLTTSPPKSSSYTVFSCAPPCCARWPHNCAVAVTSASRSPTRRARKRCTTASPATYRRFRILPARPAPCHRPQPRRPLPPPSAPAMAAGTGARPRRHPRHAASGQQGGALFSRTPLAPPHPRSLLGTGAGWRGAAVGRLHPALEHRWHKGHRRGQRAAYFCRR